MDEKQIECGGFTFLSNFDSANLARVELVPRKQPAHADPSTKPNRKPKINTVNRYLSKKPKTIEYPDYEFNIWTNPDCVGTEFENCNRTWFYFGITGGTVFSLVKINIIDLNKQSKMYSQGMAPVYKIVPGKCQWERIHDKPVFTSDNNIFTISFKYRTTENIRAITYFAFTYPFSYLELQHYLGTIDLKMSKQENHIPKPEIKFNKGLKIINDINDAVYYHRETLCHSLENRKIDLITISSHHNITAERETRLQKLFPDQNIPRPFKFCDKKVIFISARVHPGETPSSFVMNGILNLLIQKDDPIAILLRRQFIFKLIPMLNPDGVARGHYRTDTRGCNLNRYYLNPSCEFHPSIFGARSLIRYHHFGEEVDEEIKLEKFDVSSQVDPNEFSESDFSSSGQESPKPIADYPGNMCNLEIGYAQEKAVLTVDLFDTEIQSSNDQNFKPTSDEAMINTSVKRSNESLTEKEEVISAVNALEADLLSTKEENKRFKSQSDPGERSFSKKSSRCKRTQDSGLFLYLDMHGHASKKGVFMYGNHFDKIEDSVECMLFPKIMSVNSQNFHFSACNFTEKNMYLRDKRDGTSREGSGRVAVLRLTGLIRSYTLECNYNTGKFVNKLPQCSRDLPGKSNTNLLVPPKYSPGVYEEIGRSLCVSLLDLTNSNPWSRIPNSEYHTLFGIRDWLRLKTISESFLYHRPIGRSLLRSKYPSKSSQTQVMMGFLRPDIRPGKLLPNVLIAPLHSKQSVSGENNSENFDRRENITTFRGGTCSAIMLRREAGPSPLSKRALRVSSALQGLGGNSRPVKPMKKSIYWTDKVPKFKQFSQKLDGISGGGDDSYDAIVDGENRMVHCENDRRLKPTLASDQCLYKQTPKRLKICKADESGKIKIMGDWSKEDAVAGPSCSDIVTYTRLSRSVGNGGGNGGNGGNNPTNGGGGNLGDGKKRLSAKSKQQIPPLKFKKSLEKRRGSDASRKKSKTLFKKSGKIILTNNDMSKNSIERKRRKN